MTDVSSGIRPDSRAAEWHRLPPAAGLVRAVAGAATGFFLGILAAIAVSASLPPADGVLVPLVGLAVLVSAVTTLGAWLGRARWRRTRWRLDAQGLRVRRGLLWRVEVLVPRSRVQHLDVERGPLERQFGLATLVVHTAGSQTPALRQSGFTDADAVALRDALIPEARDGDAL